jgi:hypothetical protein
MERMMDGMNGGMETSAPMPDMGTTDGGGAAERSRSKRPSRPKAAKKTGGKAKPRARKTGGKRSKGKARAKARKSGGSKRAKKGGRRR